MAKVITLRSEPRRDPRREKIRRDVSDLLHMLSIVAEREIGGPVAKTALLPVNVQKLAMLLGMHIERVEELGGVALGNPWAERDVKVPGLFDRFSKTITFAQKGPLEQQRYTVAHEIAHLLYHSGPLQLRERASRGHSRGVRNVDQGQSHPEEREAEIFAAELLMPVELVEEAMIERFGGRIDGTLPHDDLAYFLSLAVRRKIDPRQLAGMPQPERAKLFAAANNYRSAHFKPLTSVFGVSIEAMALRLVELGLVV